MKHLKELEREHKEYAQVITDFLAEPRSNGQLIDLATHMKNYLLYASDELRIYNDYIDKFIGVINKLP